MADYCFECWNKLNNGTCKRGEYVLSKEVDLCEGCGEYKRVIEFKKQGGIVDFGHIHSIIERIIRKK